ncbi:MAG: hypothetical protein FJX52_02885 [Alphaproteobacteria bacterium]|nr:hypothetical protein [Alphaproteobacteria bacterium]
MAVDGLVLLALFGMGAVTYATRVGGFWLMRFVTISPRVEAALRAIPISVMTAGLAPMALASGPAEALGYVVAIVLMVIVRFDILAAFGGVAAVALARHLMAGGGT